MSLNGGPRVTYVAEMGSAKGVYVCRAICTRCVPTWRGITHSSRRGARGVLEVRDAARVDVLRHADRVHDGRLSGR